MRSVGGAVELAMLKHVVTDCPRAFVSSHTTLPGTMYHYVADLLKTYAHTDSHGKGLRALVGLVMFSSCCGCVCVAKSHKVRESECLLGQT